MCNPGFGKCNNSINPKSPFTHKLINRGGLRVYMAQLSIAGAFTYLWRNYIKGA